MANLDSLGLNRLALVHDHHNYYHHHNNNHHQTPSPIPRSWGVQLVVFWGFGGSGGGDGCGGGGDPNLLRWGGGQICPTGLISTLLVIPCYV